MTDMTEFGVQSYVCVGLVLRFSDMTIWWRYDCFYAKNGVGFKPGREKGMDVDAFLPFLQLVELFQRNKSTISRHIKNVFEKGECSFIDNIARRVPL